MICLSCGEAFIPSEEGNTICDECIDQADTEDMPEENKAFINAVFEMCGRRAPYR